jgi:hypothetical protein
MAEQGIEMIAPHRRNRRKPRMQDGRKLRRYLRRWKVEWLFAWLGNFRRLPVRYERHLANYLGFVQLASSFCSDTVYEMTSSHWNALFARRIDALTPTASQPY